MTKGKGKEGEKKKRSLVLNARRKGIIEVVKSKLLQKKNKYEPELAKEKERQEAIQLLYSHIDEFVKKLADITANNEWANRMVFTAGFARTRDEMAKDMKSGGRIIAKYPPIIEKINADIKSLEENPKEFYVEIDGDNLGRDGWSRSIKIEDKFVKRHGDDFNFLDE